MSNKGKDWYVYMVRTQSGKLYTGIATDLQRRFEEHTRQNKGAKFFRISPAKEVVYQQKCCGRSEASKREHEIKSMSKKQKLALILEQENLN